MSTDDEWEKWGAQDPYFGVLTHPKFRRAALDAAARAEFFSLGEQHAASVLELCRSRLDPAFQPRRALDFGCGVARIVIPFARLCEEVVGMDISLSMLDEARRNCEAAGMGNVVLVRSDDGLSQVTGDFDLVHSAIVLQHIETDRGLRLLEQLIGRIRPAGMGVLQLTFAWDHHDANLGVAPPPPPPVVQPWWAGARRAGRVARPGDADELLQLQPGAVPAGARGHP